MRALHNEEKLPLQGHFEESEQYAKWWYNKKGQALFLVIGILAVLSILTSAALAIARNQRITGIQQNKQMQAYFIADAGIIKGIAKIKEGNFDLSSLKNLSYGGGKIEIVMPDPPINGPGTYMLTSTGVYPNPDDHPSVEPEFFSRRTITAKIRIGEGTGNPPGGGVEPGGEGYFDKGIWTNSFTVNKAGRFKSAIYCTGNVNVNNSLHIGEDSKPQNIYANGNVTLENACKIRGNVYAHGPVDLSNGDSVSETIQSYSNVKLGNGNKVNVDVLTHGDIEIVGGSNFNRLQANGKVFLKNDVTVNSAIRTGGDLYLYDGNKVGAPIWTMGNLTMINNNTIDGTAWVHGSCSLGNGGKVNGGVLYLDDMEPLELNIPSVPSVPLPNLSWYKTEAQKISGRYFNEDTELKLEDIGDGIYFIDENLEFPSFWSNTNKFSGQATIVAYGNIIIPNGKDIFLTDKKDSLLLIAGDNITLANDNKVNAFLWAGNKVKLNDANTVKGGIISPVIEAKNSSEIEQVDLQKSFDIKIESWQ